MREKQQRQQSPTNQGLADEDFPQEASHEEDLRIEMAGIDTNRNKQFDVTYNEDEVDLELSGEGQLDAHRESNNHQYKDNGDEEEDDDDEDNPMARKLKEMKQKLRNQIQTDDPPPQPQRANMNKQRTRDEDNQGYDEYNSPDRRQSAQSVHTMQSVKQEEKKDEEKAKPIAQGSQLPIGAYGGANFDKIKNSKLFQKFLQKETGAAKPKEEPKPLNSVSSKASIQPAAKSVPPAKGGVQNSPDKNRKQWEKEGAKQSPKGALQMDDLNLTQQTHEDFYESKMRSNQQRAPSQQQQQYQQPYRQQNNFAAEGNLDFSIEGIQQQNQFLDDSQFFQNPANNLDNQFNPYFQNMRQPEEKQAYLLNHSELNNEGELIGYSEQILGRINDMAPGIPNQDEVLCHQPPESFVNLMHEQFNNEMPWMINNKMENLGQNRMSYNSGAKPELAYNNAPQQFEHQKVEPIRQEMGHVKEEMRKMKSEFEFVNERFHSLKQQYDKLQADYNKDKNFYEEALEARMNQLEELEQENEALKRKLDDVHHREMDYKQQIDQLHFDNDMIKRNLNSNSQTKDALSKKEEDLVREIRQLQDQVREQEFEVERGVQDQTRIKTQLERALQEADRLKQGNEYSESTVQQKEQEKQQVANQLADAKQRLQHEQTEQHYLRNQNEELKNELGLVKQQLNMGNNVQEQLRAQLFDFRDKMSEAEHREFLANSTKDMMQREIQQLRTQLSQANAFIQQQALFYTQGVQNVPQKPPVFGGQSTNWENQSNQQMDTYSVHSRESAVPNISPPKNKRVQDSKKQSYDQNQQPISGTGPREQHQKHQLRSNNIGSILNWVDEGATQQPGTKAPQKFQSQVTPTAEVNIAFPSRQQSMNEIPVGRHARTQQQQPESKVEFPSRQGQTPAQMSLDGMRQEQEEPRQSFSGMNKQQNNAKQLQSTVLGKEDAGKKQKQLQNVETNLLQLNIERDKYKAEFDKIPENAKTIAQRRRREDLERELGILSKNIASLKTKLRELESSH